MNKLIIKIAVMLFFIMFIYSGFNKIIKFDNKVKVLTNKTELPTSINKLGMIMVMLLEIIGSIIIIIFVNNNKLINKNLVKLVLILFMLFLIIVTMLYHPPNKKLIPFLSNLTTFSGLLIIYGIYF